MLKNGESILFLFYNFVTWKQLRIEKYDSGKNTIATRCGTCTMSFCPWLVKTNVVDLGQILQKKLQL